MSVPERTMSPPRSEVDRLVPPLTPGERRVFDFLDRSLSVDWELYSQPFMNGSHPDFVVLNERVGIGVIEVKDWSASTLAFKPGAPLAQVRLYREEISRLYCPSLGTGSGIAAVTGILVFTEMTTAEAVRLMQPVLGRVSGQQQRYVRVAGNDRLGPLDLAAVFPTGTATSSRIMSSAVADDLRRWLVEPAHAREQRSAVVLDADQRRLASTRTPSGYRRIRGPAGSGKSLVLASRAAALANEGKDVLVVSYNHTLTNYLGDLVRRAGARRTSITWLGFHGWCKRTMIQAGRDASYRDLAQRLGQGDEKERILDTEMANETLRALIDGPDAGEVPDYDAVLVDEGQDFRLDWWNALRKVVRPDGEMLLVADRAQDIYERRSQWTETAMVGAGFPGGRWSELGVAYRMPAQLTALLGDFHRRFIDDPDAMPLRSASQPELPILRLSWHQTTEDKLGFEFMAAVEQLSDAPWSDLCVIADTKAGALTALDELERRGIECVHTLAEDVRVERALKHTFFRGGARVKVTTVHSFKGWEAARVVVILTSDAPRLAHTAMTRLLRDDGGSSLTVLSTVERFRAHGRGWPTFVDST